MHLTFEIEGLEELKRELDKSTEVLEGDLALMSIQAAEAGVSEAKRNHPYTDRTGDLTGEATVLKEFDSRGNTEAEMLWPENYASFVDKGTSRAKPYPFTPQAVERAEQALKSGVDISIAHFADRIESF